MKRSVQQSISRSLRAVSENSWAAYLTILLLQVKVMLWIWDYRDLTPGDTSSYYQEVFSWLDEGKASIVWSPLYTSFLALLHAWLDNAFWVLLTARIGIAACASLLVLALLRRLLPHHIALIIAAWWTVLPINFDTVYTVHLFSALFPLFLFVVAAYLPNIYGRGIVLGGLLFTAALVRNEYGALFFLWLIVISGYELFQGRKDGRAPLRKYLTAYGVPFITALFVIGAFYLNSTSQYPGMAEEIEAKHTVNVCQIYAYNRIQQGDPWNLDPWTQCDSLMVRDFGRSSVTFSQTFFLNPGKILDHIRWNVRLIPSGTQLALFNYFSGGPNPDYMPAKATPLVWVPFLLASGLAAFGALKYLVLPGLRRRSPENAFPWLLMTSTTLLVLGLMMMQRPRPSYMFPYSLFIMASAGLGLRALLNRVRIDNSVRICFPLSVLLLVLCVPPYYDADYVNIFGYKGQGLRESYEDVAPHIDGADLTEEDLVVIPAGDYGTVCNYLGITCLSLNSQGNISAERMRELVLTAPGGPPEGDVYALYVEDMIGKISAGTDRRQGHSTGYLKLNCSPVVDDTLSCGDIRIDLAKGVLNDGLIDVPLRNVLFVNNGFVVDRKTYGADKGYYLQILMDDEQIEMILMVKDSLFRTKFNQRYLLGNFDRTYFEEVYNDFPEARIFKFKKPEVLGLNK